LSVSSFGVYATVPELFVAQVYGFGVSFVDAVEEEFESAMRLSPIRDFRGKHEQFSSTDLRIEHGDGLLQISLPTLSDKPNANGWVLSTVACSTEPGT
jgi:hypothetical protein